jgi:predicted MPP superfamily phosphohydrolase
MLNIYAASRIIFNWPWAQAHQGAAWVCTGIFFLLQLASPFLGRRLFPRIKHRRGWMTVLNWASYTALGIMTLLVVYGLATEIFNLLWKAVSSSSPDRIDRWTFLIFAGATVISIIVGIGQAHLGPWVVKVNVPLKNLPSAFDGFTIVQISDLHVGPTIRRSYTQKVVAIANSLKPDLIALTGDFVDGFVPDLAPHVAPLAALRAGHGVFFVTGNHEYYWDAAAWVAEFKRLGMRVLSNEHEVITRDKSALVIAGVEDYSTRNSGWKHAWDPGKALAGAPQKAPKVLLAHQPSGYHAAWKAGADLQLSGHSHAGQYFPFSLFIRFFHRFHRGLNRYKNMWIYVSKGTGYWGPPLRLGVPPEITLITLRVEK